MASYEEKESYAVSHLGGIGASEVAPILGLSPFRTAIDVWESKVFPERVPELDKECLWFGSALEPVIRGRYSMVHDVEIVPPERIGEFFPNSRTWNGQTIVTGEESWELASADGWIPAQRDGLEIKNVGRKNDDWGEFGTDNIPAYYLTQCIWGIHVYAARGWVVAPLFSGNTLGNYYIRRDDNLIQDIREAVRDFWESYCVTKIEPPIDESESYGRYLSRKFSLGNGQVITNPSREIVAWAEKMHQADLDLKEAEARKMLANNHLRALVGEAKSAKTPLGSVGWVRPKERTVVDETAALIDMGARYDLARAQDAPSAKDVIASHSHPCKGEPFFRAWWHKQTGMSAYVEDEY